MLKYSPEWVLLLRDTTGELELSELLEQKDNVIGIITALQNDSDRDVRHLLSHLSDISVITPANTDMVCMSNIAFCRAM